MATLTKELEARLGRAGIQENPRRIEELILAAVDDILGAMQSADPVRGLPVEEQAALRRGGLTLEAVDLGDRDPVLATAARYAAMVVSGLSVAQAARKLGIDESRVRHRLSERTLYGIKVRGAWMLPAFQFSNSGPVPGVEQVLPRVPTDLHPVALLNWFTLPEPDLVVGEEEAPVSPRDWLLMGRDPKVVGTLAESL